MDKNKKSFNVSGMDCASCATLLELDLEDAGIKAKCSYAASSLEVDGESDISKVEEIVKNSGFSLSPKS